MVGTAPFESRIVHDVVPVPPLMRISSLSTWTMYGLEVGKPAADATAIVSWVDVIAELSVVAGVFVLYALSALYVASAAVTSAFASPMESFLIARYFSISESATAAAVVTVLARRS
jgi:hypothetical protein